MKTASSTRAMCDTIVNKLLDGSLTYDVAQAMNAAIKNNIYAALTESKILEIAQQPQNLEFVSPGASNEKI
jgi:hypothetical protein